MFNLSDKDILNPNLVKVIDSIAGAGKSRKTHEFFTSHNIPYMRLTSTNTLKNDAEKKFDMKCYTIASGLFTNSFMHFYADFKDPDIKNIVIDEALQADPKIIDWINEHKGAYNIIVTTDSHQMLSPTAEILMMDKFRALCDADDTLYVNVKETLRTSDTATKTLYENLYEQASENFFYTTDNLTSMFETVDEVPYNEASVFITHTKKLETYIYEQNSLNNRYDLDFVPKGYLASKPLVDPDKYPILSQEQSQKMRSTAYLQIANVATPTRYQGSEVEIGQDLYYFVCKNSVIQARELYTVVTRCKDISSLKIVVIDLPDDELLTELCGKPIKKEIFYSIDDIVRTTKNASVLDIRKILKSAKEYENCVYSENYILDAIGNIAYLNTAYCKTLGIAVVNQLISLKDFKAILASRSKIKKTEEDEVRPTSLSALANRDSAVNYTYVEEIYKILDDMGVDKIRPARILAPSEHKETTHYFDMTSAFPHVLKFGKIAVNGVISKTYDKNLLNFYVYNGAFLTNDGLIKEDDKIYLVNEGFCKEEEFRYAFSTPWQYGCYIGEDLYRKVFDSVETKDSIKGLHYGVYEQAYFEFNTKEQCYIRRPEHNHELLLACVWSELDTAMLKIQKALDGDKIITDGFFFNMGDKTPEDVAKIATTVLPEYFHWKFYPSNDKTECYTNYDIILTKKQKKAAKQRERRKNMTPEQKAKEAERKRLARQRKKDMI